MSQALVLGVLVLGLTTGVGLDIWGLKTSGGLDFTLYGRATEHTPLPWMTSKHSCATDGNGDALPCHAPYATRAQWNGLYRCCCKRQNSAAALIKVHSAVQPLCTLLLADWMGL